MSEQTFPSLLESFPKGYTARGNQLELLPKIHEALNSDKKHVMICAPTGTGKSFISAAIANATEEPCDDYIDYINSYRAFLDGNEEEADDYRSYGSAVLTVTKQLQDQYVKDFDDISLMKGKTNYLCDVDNDYDIEDAPCNDSQSLKRECWSCKRCPYYEARNHAILDKFGVFNYNVFMNVPNHVRKKQVVICDEASELENTLVDIFTFDATYKEIDKLLETDFKRLKLDNPQNEEYDGHAWLLELQEAILEKMEYYKEAASKREYKLHAKHKYALKKCKRWLVDIMQVLNNWSPSGGNENSTEYVIELTEPDNFKPDIDEGVVFTPLRVNKLSRHLFNYADKVVYLSATIIDHRKELADLGVEKDDYVYIEADTDFDPKKSPIHLSQKYPLSYKTLSENLPKVLKMSEGIIKKHKGDKGLIHTVNFKITKAYMEKFNSDSRMLFRDGGMTNKLLLEEHIKSDEDTIMVSPSMSHGVDLKGDLGKFQIISKVPYLPIGNKRIKRLCDIDYQWYINKTLSSLVQMAGRCTRNSDDEAVTYIVDGAAAKLIKMNWKKFPKYFRDRIK